MGRRTFRFGLVGLLVLVGVLMAVSASSAGTTSWDNTIGVPGAAALNAGGHAEVLSLSCATAGDCSAGGYYTDVVGRLQAFVVKETAGVWGNAITAPGTGALNTDGDARVTSVSCASAGNCAAGGYYSQLGDQQAFVIDETNGSWSTAVDVPGTDVGSAVSSVSCATAGNCTAGGDFESDSQAFVAEETNGSWGNAIEVPGSAALNSGDGAAVTSVSCATAGNCTVGGTYLDSPLTAQAFVADETNGSWGNAIEAPASATLNSGGNAAVTSVSCSTVGNCAAGGVYFDGSDLYQAFVVDETNGSWGNAIEVPGSGTLNAHGNARVNSISCATDGNCAAGGKYLDGSDQYQAFLVDEKNGSWGNATRAPGTGTLNGGGSAAVYSVSCIVAGGCAAGGYYRSTSAGQQAFVASEAGGIWRNAIQVPGSAILNTHGFASVRSVSCGAVGECGAGGVYTDSGSDAQAFVTAAGYYSLLYDGNGQTAGSAPSDGSSPYAAGAPVTALGAGSLTRTGYTFAGWNAAANGSDTTYLPGHQFPMPAANTTLHAQWINTTTNVHCNQKAHISNPGTNLSGVWESNLSGTYYVRELGSCIYWIGLGTYDSQSHRYDYVNAFFGSISSTGTTINGYWFDVNAVNSTQHGTLKLHVANSSHMTKSAQAGGFSAGAWSRQSSAAATFVSPSTSPIAVKNVGLTCDPTAPATPNPNDLPSTIAIPAIAGTTARYNVRQIGSCVIFWGRPRVSPVPPASPQWGYSQVFFGRSTGSGLSEVVQGPWANIPAGTAHAFGQLTLTIIGAHAFHTSGTGGWVTTNFSHTP
jgi:uncharacterized repeat protein (TIGR02543 family)